MKESDILTVREQADLLQRKAAAYQQPNHLVSIWQLSSTLLSYVGAWVVSYFAFEYSFWLAVPCIAIACLLMIRTFILFHDCGHQSFFRSRKANDFWGVITGILTFTPYHHWHGNHAKHHATSANLDKRGHGDVWMMTVREYQEASRGERLKYRFYRNPFVMFLLGPLAIILINHRIVRPNSTRIEKRSVVVTNIGIVLLGAALAFIMGWQAYLVIQLGILYFGLMVGIWLFYVQHQFEDVYWSRRNNWDFVTAALEGGSFYDLPAVLRWFTGSIGYHHIHHLNSRIPNYRLAECHEQIPELQSVPRVGLRRSLKALRYRLLDEETGKMVGYREARMSRDMAA